MTESLAQKLFAALSKNSGMYLNDYEVARMSGLSEDELELAKSELDEILKGSDTSLTVTKKGDRRWKMVSRRPKVKKEEEKQVGLF